MRNTSKLRIVHSGHRVENTQLTTRVEELEQENLELIEQIDAYKLQIAETQRSRSGSGRRNNVNGNHTSEEAKYPFSLEFKK